MIYTTYSQAWLEDPSSIKGILVEVTAKTTGIPGYANGENVLYLSNIGYMTGDASITFTPNIIGGVKFTETLPIDGQPTMSFGDIEVSNPNGDLDNWLDNTKYIIVNRSIRVWLGDPFWGTTNLADVKSKFLKIFDGVSAGVDSRSRGTINIKVRDKLETLNTPISANVMGVLSGWGAGQSNPNQLKPLVFGEVFNITPTLYNPSQLEYIVNDGPTERLIEVRDNGVPISAVDITDSTSTTGRFKLLKPSAGTITASVQGVKNSITFSTAAQLNTYNNTITNLIVLLVTQYGTNKLGASELDHTNLTAFDTANPVPAGIYLGDTSNVLSVCQQLAASIGAQVFMTRLGTLQILRVGVPTSDASVSITDSDILHHSLSISNTTEVLAATNLAYCKNWTTQSGLVTAIYPEDKVNFDTAEYNKALSDPTTVSDYKLSSTTAAKETLLITGTTALAEANRLNSYYKVPRITYKFTGTAKLLSLKLGQPVQLIHNRFGLSGAGKAGQVVSLSPNWLKSTIEVEVII